MATSDLPVALTRVQEAHARLRAHEADVRAARAELAEAIEAAASAGASYGLIGRLIGLSPQRVHDIAKRR